MTCQSPRIVPFGFAPKSRLGEAVIRVDTCVHTMTTLSRLNVVCGFLRIWSLYIILVGYTSAASDYSENLQISALQDGSLLFRAEYTISQEIQHKCTQSTTGAPMCVTHSGRLPTSHISLFIGNKVQK